MEQQPLNQQNQPNHAPENEAVLPVSPKPETENGTPLSDPALTEESAPAKNDVPAKEPEIWPAESAEGDLDLDPVLKEGIKVNAEESTVPPVSPDSPSEPIAPMMPVIVPGEFVPAKEKDGNHGIRLFAAIVAVVLIMCACVAGGYFMGIGKTPGGVSTVDLASKPEAKDAQSLSQVYAAVNPSIVGIYVYNESGIASSATGVVYGNGYIVTNDHIYDGAGNAKFKIYTYDGKAYDAEYVAGDTRSDLAVLKTAATGLKAATFGNSAELSIGETVVAVGCPNGAEEPASISQGCISALNRRVSITSSYSGKFIQTDTAINPGNSGGALCNLYGQIIGITSAKLADTEYDNVGFAIPTTLMKKVVDSLIENGYVKGRAKLGISYYNITSLASEIKKAPAGLQIAAIDESSSLYKKVSVDDYITHVNGQALTSANILLDLLENCKAGDTVKLTIYSAEKKTSADYEVVLLEDQGSSSYRTGAAQGSKPNSSGNSSSDYNASQFSFPNGD